MLGPLLFILHTSKIFELDENSLYAYAEDFTLLAVFRNPTAGTWLGFRSGAITGACMIMNPYKTEALVVSRSRTVNPPHGDSILSGVSIRAFINMGAIQPRHPWSEV